jgi:hypothetical protein
LFNCKEKRERLSYSIVLNFHCLSL